MDHYVADTVQIQLHILPADGEGLVITDTLHPGENTLTGYAECMNRLRRSVLLSVESGRIKTTPRKP